MTDVYNKEHDVWEHCSDMVIARHSAGTLIYIIGGTTAQYTIGFSDLLNVLTLKQRYVSLVSKTYLIFPNGYNVFLL